MLDLSFQEMFQKLPPELQAEARDFVEFLLERKTPQQRQPMQFQWAGALKDLREQDGGSVATSNFGMARR